MKIPQFVSGCSQVRTHNSTLPSDIDQSCRPLSNRTRLLAAFSVGQQGFPWRAIAIFAYINWFSSWSASIVRHSLARQPLWVDDRSTRNSLARYWGSVCRCSTVVWCKLCYVSRWLGCASDQRRRRMSGLTLHGPRAISLVWAETSAQKMVWLVPTPSGLGKMSLEGCLTLVFGVPQSAVYSTLASAKRIIPIDSELIYY